MTFSVGFKGSPNVGTVVLGEMIKGADWFQAFCNACQKGDRIFIISSIFGGTGASGYPLLEKTVRNSTNHPNVKDAIMGAVSVLPYFSLEDPLTTDSDIDSANFLTKAKSALAYYENSVNSDYLYYVGEQDMKTTYANDEKKQEDKAHFVELVAATALFDFLSKTDKPDKTQALSRAIRENVESLSVSSLGDAYNDVVKAVADMMLLSRLVYFCLMRVSFPCRKTVASMPISMQINLLSASTIFLPASLSGIRNLPRINAVSLRSISLTLTTVELKISNWIQDFSLDAKDETYYLLDMIRASNKDDDDTHTIRFRRFLDYAYQAIDKYTSKIM